jgi:hypothetical protein
MHETVNVEQRTVANYHFLIETVYSLEYDGVWRPIGYKVSVNNKVKWFFGYPSNADLLGMDK